MQRLNIILNALYQLGLVLSDGASDMRTHKQRVEPREYAEHLVCVLGCPELVAQVSGYAGFHAI